MSGRSRAEVSRKIEATSGARAWPASRRVRQTGTYLARWVVAVRPRLRAGTHREYARHVADYWSPLASVPRSSPASPRPRSRGRWPASVTPPVADDDPSRPLDPPAGAPRRPARRAGHPQCRRPRPSSARRPTRDAGPVRGRGWSPPRGHGGRAIRAAVRARRRVRPAGRGAMGLRWSDVDLAARSLMVRRSLARAHGGGYALAEPKTARTRRTVMLPAIALDALRRQKARQAAARLPAGTDGRTAPGCRSRMPWAVPSGRTPCPPHSGRRPTARARRSACTTSAILPRA